jgi:hypothetical protein
MHSLRSPPALSIRAHIAVPSRDPPASCPSCRAGGTPGSAFRTGGVRGKFLETIKFFSLLPIISNEQAPGFRRKHAPSPGTPENNLPRRKQIGENNMGMRSPLRMEFPPRSPRDPWRACARESTPGKGSHRARLPRGAISSSREGRFSGIANRPCVIRGQWVNIKKVYGNRHFPVDTANENF